jgi:DNA-binding response OmpR family regulator
MRVLLLQEALPAAVHVRLAFQQMDCAVDEIATVDEAGAALAVHHYDLLVVDLDSLHEDVDDFLRRTRASHRDLRQIVLASRTGIDRIAVALDRGASEFLIKPVDAEELRLRVSGFAATGSDKGAIALECGPLRLQVPTRQVWLDGKAIELSPRERAVLQILLRESGNVVSKAYIASRIFSMDDDATPSAIETYVSRLRRKTAHPNFEIRTVHGLGYRLVER